MRNAYGDFVLSEMPHILGYETELWTWRERPLFAPFLPVRNVCGESALDRSCTAAVSLVATTHSGIRTDIVWLPASHIAPGSLDTGLVATYPTAPAVLAPNTLWHKSFQTANDTQTLAQMQAQAIGDSWNTDTQNNDFENLDTATRLGLARIDADTMALGYCKDGYVTLRTVDNSFAPTDSPTYLPVIYYADEENPVLQLQGAWGVCVCVIARTEVWVSHVRGNALYLRRFILGVADETWAITNDSEIGRVWSSVEPRLWWDSLATQVIAMPDGGRLITYQAGPGRAMARIWRNNVLSDPWPIMYADQELAFQHCRVVSLLVHDGLYYGLCERGIEGSDSTISSWFTSIVVSDDGKRWMDWHPVARGRLRGCLTVLGGFLCVITPGRMYMSPGVGSLGNTTLGNAAFSSFEGVESWRYDSNKANQTASSETIIVLKEGESPPVAGDRLERILLLNGSHESAYVIGQEFVDRVTPTQTHNRISLSVTARGPMRDGLLYQPPIDELFLSGLVRHVDFALQTVVTKQGALEREEGDVNENGHVLTASENDSIAILPQPVHSGNFWTSTRFTQMNVNVGLLFFYQGDIDTYGEAAAGADYCALRYINDGSDKLQLVRSIQDGKTVLYEQAISLADSVAELGVHYENGFLHFYLSYPDDIPYYAEPAILSEAHRRNQNSALVQWVQVGEYWWPDPVAGPCYCGLIMDKGSKARHLTVLECKHAQTIGSTVEAIGWRAGMDVQVVGDIEPILAADVLSVLSPAFIASGEDEDGWQLQTQHWMWPTALRGLDAEIEVSLPTEGDVLHLGCEATVNDPGRWCAGGLDLIMARDFIAVRRRTIVNDGEDYLIAPQELARKEFPVLRTSYEVRVLLFPDNLLPSRSYLYVYIDDAWFALFVLEHTTLGGYVGVAGNGDPQWRNLKLRVLPLYLGDHVWSYKRNAVDEMISLVRDIGYQLVERPDGTVAVLHQDSSFDLIGGLPAVLEVLRPGDEDNWASAVRVWGAEVYATYIVPGMLPYGLRMVELNAPHLLTEEQCLSYARDTALYMASRRSVIGVEGMIDPRITLADTYTHLDSDLVERAYVVTGYTFVVNHRRQPRSSMSAELRRLD